MYLDWQSRPEDIYTIDIETDDLDATVIWVMCWENVRTGETGDCVGYEQIRDFFETTNGSFYVGHNLLKFDGPVLNKLVGTRLSVKSCIDTLVLSTLYSPNLQGGHALEAWGTRIGYPKIEFNDWSHLSDEMITYCRRDVEITTKLFKKITRVLGKIGFKEMSCYIQHHITAIAHRQQKTGFMFDGERGLRLYQQLRQQESDLEDAIRVVFPSERVLVRNGNMQTKAGKLTAIYQRDLERYMVVPHESGSYSAFEDIQFNIGSPKQRVEKLLALGWQNLPDEVTKTGTPKPFDKGDLVPSLKAFVEENPMPEIELIARWMSVNGRANMINNWLENWDEDTGCIHGKLFVADTLRFRHQAPNTANIPAVRISKTGGVLKGDSGYWTYEARDLWTARRGRTLVGTDAAGLELRMLAHYLNRPEFTEQVVNGDPHQYNADTVGITRPNAKTLLYAIMYGAQGAKVARTIKVSLKEGTKVRKEFLERLGIEGIMNESIREQSSGRVWLVDGSGVVCPSPHSALNYKLQGSGARVMGLAWVLLEKEIRRKGLDSFSVGNIHDEMQYDVNPKDAEEHGKIAVQAIRNAGEELNLNVLLDGTSKTGNTWSETH